MGKLFNKTRKNSDEEAPTFISKGCVIEGFIKTVTIMEIEGTFVGDILHAENLIVGENGVIDGNVQTKEVIVMGEINGNVSADSIEIKRSGKVSGRLKTQNLLVERGAVYNGDLAMDTISSDTKFSEN